MISTQDRATLITLAEESIQHQFEHHNPPHINTSSYSEALQQHRASFVTLKIQQRLRGCIGTLTAYRPLVDDVAANALAAAFNDTRFQPLKQEEFHSLEYHISALTPPEPMGIHSRNELLTTLRINTDGLILSDKHHQATFLPSVWEELPEPEMFVGQLMRKAGLPTDYWSDTIQVQRYTVESWGEENLNN